MTLPTFKRIIERIKGLWLCFVLLLLFHTQLSLMPLYHNDTIKVNDMNPIQQQEIFLLMLGYYSIPLLIYLVLCWNTSTLCRFDLFCHTHFFITLIYSLSNIMHFVSEILFSKRPDQIILTFLMLIIGILLNLQSWLYVTQMNLYTESIHNETESLIEEETGTLGAVSSAEGTNNYGATDTATSTGTINMQEDGDRPPSLSSFSSFRFF